MEILHRAGNALMPFSALALLLIIMVILGCILFYAVTLIFTLANSAERPLIVYELLPVKILFSWYQKSSLFIFFLCVRHADHIGVHTKRPSKYKIKYINTTLN